MKREDKSKVTIYTIAAECGVSPATVSRVANGQRVSPRSYALVQPLIEKYRFAPNPLAQAMSKNRSQTLGVILPDISNPYFSALFLEIQKYALQQNYGILLCNTLYGGSSHGIESPFGEQKYFRMMTDKKVDGVILTGGELDKDEVSPRYVEELNRMCAYFPVVAIGETLPECDCIFINRSLAGGVPVLIRHLAALGRRKIGFIGGEPGVKTTTARYAAYRRTLQSLQLPFDESWTALTDYYLPDGYAAMKTLLENKENRPTAVLAINDTVALGAIRAAADCHLRVPEDISIVSCDRFPAAEYTVPRLTSVDQQNSYLGRMSILTLIGAINGVDDRAEIVHTPRLVVGESCGAQLADGFTE